MKKGILLLTLLLSLPQAFSDVQPPTWDEFKPAIEFGMYWGRRHEQFDNEVALCQALKTDSEKAMCYMQVRQIESQKSSARRIEKTLW